MHIFANPNTVKAVAKKIEKHKKKENISTYEIALAIGMSEYPIYTLLRHNKATTATVDKITNYFEREKNK